MGEGFGGGVRGRGGVWRRVSRGGGGCRRCRVRPWFWGGYAGCWEVAGFENVVGRGKIHIVTEVDELKIIRWDLEAGEALCAKNNIGGMTLYGVQCPGAIYKTAFLL